MSQFIKKNGVIVVLLMVNLYSYTQNMDIVELKLNELESQKNESNPFLFSYTCEDFFRVFHFKEGDLNIVYKNHIPFTGTMKINYHNGSVLSTIDWLNGQREGEELLYFRNQNKAQRAFYKHGELTGQFIQYFENGHIQLIVEYDKGQVNGTYSLYYKNGRLQEQGRKKEGKKRFLTYRFGHWTYYYENGNLKEEGMWGNTEGGSAKVGEWKYYNEQGEPIGIKTYPSDTRIDRIVKP